MHFQLNFKSGLPVYLQIVEQVRAAAASGALRPGEPLPGIRPLAEQLRVNRNTIAKAYTELENQGVIETLAGKGCFLADGQSRLKKSARHDLLATEIDQAIVAAHHLQVSRTDFIELVKERLDHFAEQQKTHAEKDRP
ncbi:MAG: GntR family transcriptional regulator [Proteobacteria bacterium]|nr:GntR family transcriptional regulator [Verrucomicrobiota bacterium]NBU10472.1 GntR family transcriptional regulator [Pseudomonadota bacterium]